MALTNLLILVEGNQDFPCFLFSATRQDILPWATYDAGPSLASMTKVTFMTAIKWPQFVYFPAWTIVRFRILFDHVYLWSDISACLRELFCPGKLHSDGRKVCEVYIHSVTQWLTLMSNGDKSSSHKRRTSAGENSLRDCCLVEQLVI